MPAASAISRTVVAATPCRANSSAASRRMTSRRSSGWTTRASLLLVDNAFLDVDRAALLADEEPLPELQRVVPLDDRSWQDFLDSGTAVADEDVIAAARAVAPTDISDIIFTSGTTGRPK